jgi:hypothetical protein
LSPYCIIDDLTDRVGAITSKAGAIVGAVTGKAGSAVEAVISKAASVAHEVMDQVWEEVSEWTHGDMGLDFDLKMSKNLEGQYRAQPLEGLQKT